MNIEQFDTKTPTHYVLRLNNLYYSHSNEGITATTSLEQAKEFTLEEALKTLCELTKLNVPITLVPCFDKSDWLVFNAICTDQNGVERLKNLASNSHNIYLTECKQYL